MKKYLTTILAVMLTMTMTAQREKWTVKDKGPSLSNYFTPAVPAICLSTVWWQV